MSKLFGHIACGVVHLVTAGNAPRKNAEVAHIAHVRFSECLEHECSERCVVFRMQSNRVRAFRTGERVNLLHLEGVGHQLHELREQCTHPDHAFRRDTKKREEVHAFHGFLHPAQCGIAIDLPAFEIALEQCVIGGADCLDELLAISRKPCSALGRHIGFHILAFAAAGVHVGALREEIDHTAECRTGTDRHFNGNHLRREPLLDLIVNAIEIREFLVHHRYGKQYRIISFDGRAKHPLGADLHAGCSTDHAQRAVSRGKAGERIALKVERSRRVDEVDLAVHPLGVGAAERDGVTALNLFGEMVGERGPALDGAMSSAGTGGEAKRIHKTGFTATAVADHGDVSDARAVVVPHSASKGSLGMRAWRGFGRTSTQCTTVPSSATEIQRGPDRLIAAPFTCSNESRG